MIITLPYKIPLGKKNFYINLNQYRNAHFYQLNSAKIKFKELIYDQLVKLPDLNVIELCYTVFIPQNREVDTNNIASVADKFFCDALVESGKLTDDNYKYLINTNFRFGGVDKVNPRIEVEIKETQPMRRSVTLILEEQDVLQAVDDYLHKYGYIQKNEVANVVKTAEIVVNIETVNTTQSVQSAQPAEAGTKANEDAKEPLPTLLGSKPQVKPLKLNISTGENREDTNNADAAAEVSAADSDKGGPTQPAEAEAVNTSNTSSATGAAATADAPVEASTEVAPAKGSIFGMKKAAPKAEAKAEAKAEPKEEAEKPLKTSLFSFKKTSEE